MSADQHRADAEQFQRWAAQSSTDQAVVGQAARGVLSALLAVEARLGELVEQQRTTNFILACGSHRPPIDNADEFRQINETLRRALGLGLSTETTGE